MIQSIFASLVFFASLFGLASSSIAAQKASPSDGKQPTVTATLSRMSVQIADPFTLTIEVIADRSARVQFPQLRDNFGDFEVLDHRDRFGLPFDSQSRRWTRSIDLETLDTGKLEIPAIEIVVETDQNTWRPKTDPIALTVNSTLTSDSDPKTIQDIRGSVDAPIEESSAVAWMPWAVGLCVVASFFAGVVFLARKAKRPLSPRQWAMAELADADNLSITKLDHTLRTFIEHEFSFAANSLPPTQIVNELNDRDVAAEHLATIKNFFRDAEHVRFAGHSISKDKLKTWTSKLISLVQQLARSAEAQK